MMTVLGFGASEDTYTPEEEQAEQQTGFLALGTQV
jgi:hypothetical protein